MKILSLCKIGLLLLITSLILWNCEKNEIVVNTNDNFSLEKTDFTLEKISYLELTKDKEIETSLLKIKQRFSKNKNNINKNTIALSEGVSILTDKIHKVITKEAITWAFRIDKPILDSSDFENFLVKKQDEKFNYFLVSYKQESSEQYKGAIIYPINENFLNLSSLNLSRKGVWISCPDGESCGGGSISGCSGIINIIPCSNGDSYTHGPEPFRSGGYCTGTRTVIDFSHCNNTPSNPTNNTTPNSNDTNRGGGSSSGSSIITSPVTIEWDWSDSEDKIINNLTDKAKCVYDKLTKSSTNFKDMIKKFDGQFPVSHLNFRMENLGNTRGETRAPNGAGISPNYLITIVLNNNSTIHGVDYRPNLMTAKTIVHEVIHAEMFRKLLSVLDNGGNIAGVTRQQLLNVKNNFPGIYDYYKRHKNWQHQQMATHYRKTIAYVLQKFDNNNHSNQFYMDLAWEGLRYPNISTWSNQSTKEKDRINKVIKDYIETNKKESCQK